MNNDVHVALRSLEVVTVEGADAESFLHGQVSSNVAGLAVGETSPSLLLSPQGKMVAWFRLKRTSQESFEAYLQAGRGEAFMGRLKRFVLRSNVSFNLSVRQVGSVRSKSHDMVKALLSTWEEVEAPEMVDCFWPAWFGGDYLDFPSELSDQGNYDLARIEAGVPAYGLEIDAETIPASVGVVEGAVDFNKGCYVGQELVARMDSRSVAPPVRLTRVRSTSTFSKEELYSSNHQGIGRVTSIASGDGVTVGLALIKRSHIEPRATGAESGATIEIEELI